MLNTWSLDGHAVWEGHGNFRSGTLEEEVHHYGRALRDYSFVQLPVLTMIPDCPCNESGQPHVPGHDRLCPLGTEFWNKAFLP